MFRSVVVETCSLLTGLITFVVADGVHLSVFNMYHNGMNSVRKETLPSLLHFRLRVWVLKDDVF